MNKLFYKKEAKITKHDRGITYSYIWVKRFKFKIPSLFSKKEKYWCLKNKMWATEYKWKFIKIIKYEVMVLKINFYKTKTKYRINLF
jgi:hypothetical protein